MSEVATTFKFTVEEYMKLYEAGLFEQRDRVELLNGEIIVMHAIGVRHFQAVTNFNEAFIEQSRRRYMVSPGNPVQLDDWSMPEPDIALIPRTMRTAKRHPRSADALLVIEVADSSLHYDRRQKMRAYAATGVREFWILNLQENRFEVFRHPQGEAYAETFTVGLDGTISPLAFPDVTIVAAEVVPPQIED